MRFRPTNKTPSYMSRPFQMRMIMMIVSLGVVILAIRITSKPSFWAGMFPDEEVAVREEKSSSSGEPQVRSQQGLEGIPQVQLDEVLIAQTENEQESGSPEIPRENGTETGTEEPVVESSLPVMNEQPKVAGLKINPERFQPIEDYSVNVLAAESDPFFYTIYHAGQVPLQELEQAGEDVSHITLRGDPEYYRGKVVTIEGELRGLNEITADHNAYGIDKFYDAWIITPTSDNIPFRVVARLKDESLPVKGLIKESVPVSVSGYFFKVQAYPVKGGKPQMTPLLIARRITRAPARPGPMSLSKDSNPGRWLFIIFSVVFVIAIWSAYRSTVGAKRMRQHRKEVLESDGDLSELQGQASIDPGDELRKLEEEE